MQKHIVVIGGGPAGTAAAYTLQKLGYKVTIVEKAHRLGGRICSVKLDDHSFEMGAGFITSGLYPNTIKFLDASGLSSDLNYRKSNGVIVDSNRTYNAHSLLGNQWLPVGAKLLAIRQIIQALLAWWSLDIKRLTSAAKFDVASVSERFQSKSGKRLLEYLIQPALNSYLYWRPERTSQAMLMILTKTSLFKGRTYTLKHGLQQVPERLAQDSAVMLKTEVIVVEQSDTAYKVSVKCAGKNETILADGVVCATTATVVPKIIRNLTLQQQEFFRSISYSSTLVVANRYKQTTDMHNYEFAYPRAELKPMTAITLQTILDKKDYNRIAKVFASGEKANGLLGMADKEIAKELALPNVAQQKLGDTSHLTGTYVQRWAEALPEFSVGYFKRLKMFTECEQNNTSALVFAGDYLGGPYIEGAITSGMAAAEQLHNRLHTN